MTVIVVDRRNHGRYTLREGDFGHDVAAIQIALVEARMPVPVDSEYGIATRSAVYNYQRIKGIKADGVAGPQTQAAFAMAQSHAAQRNLPAGMLFSIRGNESSDVLGACTDHPSDPGYDLGVYQDSIEPEHVANQSRIRRALNIKVMSMETAFKIRAQYLRYRAWRKVSKRRAWELAVLYHNWPYVADRLAQGLPGLATPGAWDSPAQWIQKATGGRLSTPRQWVEAYIAKATSKVDWKRIK